LRDQKQIETTELVEMSITIDFKTCEILAHLRGRLPSAAVDYECVGAMHKFSIVREGLVYQVNFPERVLASRGEEELKRMLRPVVERAILGAAPRRVFVGTMAGRGA
jgi:hypothetical protein